MKRSGTSECGPNIGRAIKISLFQAPRRVENRDLFRRGSFSPFLLLLGGLGSSLWSSLGPLLSRRFCSRIFDEKGSLGEKSAAEAQTLVGFGENNNLSPKVGFRGGGAHIQPRRLCAAPGRSH